MENHARPVRTAGGEPVNHLKHNGFGPVPDSPAASADSVSVPGSRKEALVLTPESRPTALTPPEIQQRDRCETIIREGWDTFLNVAQALAIVRKNRLYRDRYATFDAYCREKWEYSKSHVNRFIEAAAVAEVLTPIGVKVKSESQLRPLVALSPQKIPAAWKRAEELAGDGPITGKIVRRAAEDFKTAPFQSPASHNDKKAETKPTRLTPALKLINKIEEAAKANDMGAVIAGLKNLRKHLSANPMTS